MLPDRLCKLTLLDLTANEIDELPDGIFSNCHKLEKVLLAYNQLRHFTSAVWQEVWDHALLDVTLEGNPLKCDCSTKWFMSKKKNVQLIGKCTEPSTFAGKTLRGPRGQRFHLLPKVAGLLSVGRTIASAT
ncbi:hypothetical protein CEXT_749301 [Caerostris extrusa]|uniref:Uncharacterized protein n=1 Tax=Caerostris extrusa TaxID=172846 RepID=A0AAV4Y7N2_CAEEX|nr:hypothetical protein CEXT_749301 [Caerostris extrusa]